MDYTNQLPAISGQTGATEKVATTVMGFLLLGAPGDAITYQEGRIEKPIVYSVSKSIPLGEPIKKPATFQPSGSITFIRKIYGFNVTELAQLLGVTRPTVYNWIKGGEVKKEISAKLQVLEAVAKHWSRLQGKDNISFLFDYKGPQANDISLREALGHEVIETDTIINLIDTRMIEYQRAAAESQQIIGNVELVKNAEIPEGAKKLNQLWSNNINKLKEIQHKDSSWRI